MTKCCFRLWYQKGKSQFDNDLDFGIWISLFLKIKTVSCRDDAKISQQSRNLLKNHTSNVKLAKFHDFFFAFREIFKFFAKYLFGTLCISSVSSRYSFE